MVASKKRNCTLATNLNKISCYNSLIHTSWHLIIQGDEASMYPCDFTSI